MIQKMDSLLYHYAFLSSKCIMNISILVVHDLRVYFIPFIKSNFQMLKKQKDTVHIAIIAGKCSVLLEVLKTWKKKNNYLKNMLSIKKLHSKRGGIINCKDKQRLNYQKKKILRV